jgi:polygalacturonase
MCVIVLAVLTASPRCVYAAKNNDVCNPQKYGAKADGITKDTLAIQAAVDACAALPKGGVVHLDMGTYLSAPIELRSNITLYIAAGSTLLGSKDFADYPQITEFRAPGLQALVSATNASNVVITGDGTIDGNGADWWKMARSVKDAGIMGSSHPRPRLIVFDHCKNVRIEGVTVQNSPFWQIVPYYTDGVVIKNIRVLAPNTSPNTDAIDPFASSNILIEHVYADVGDDDVAIKSGAINSPGPDSPSTNIIIRDCNFDHGHGVSIGSEIAGGAQNILIERVHFNGTAAGLRIKANRDRGNDVSNIVFRDVDMVNVKSAIQISEYYPKILPPAGDNPPMPVTRLTPHFHDIHIENVKATEGASAGAIVGLPESPVLNVSLKNVSIAAQTGFTISDAEVTADHFTVTAAQGDAITTSPSAKFTVIGK